VEAGEAAAEERVSKGLGERTEKTTTGMVVLAARLRSPG
jgi:hypothetical protein